MPLLVLIPTLISVSNSVMVFFLHIRVIGAIRVQKVFDISAIFDVWEAIFSCQPLHLAIILPGCLFSEYDRPSVSETRGWRWCDGNHCLQSGCHRDRRDRICP